LHRSFRIVRAFSNPCQRQHPMNKRHVSQSSCAEIFGVHRNTVANWIKQGCPFVQKANKKQGKDWVLDTADVAQWRADKAVQDTVGDTEAATEDELRRRKLAADTQLAELEVGKKRGELIPKDEIDKTLSALAIATRTRLLLVPRRCATQLIGRTNEAEIKEIIEAEQLEALSDVSQLVIDDE